MMSHISYRVGLPRTHFRRRFFTARRYASAGLCDRNVSVCPSVTRQYSAKTKKASVMISSLSGSPTILVFWCQISSRHSKWSPSGSLKQRWGGKIQPFFSFKHQYLENSYGQSYYWWLSYTSVFDWYQDRWPDGISRDFAILERNNGWMNKDKPVMSATKL